MRAPPGVGNDVVDLRQAHARGKAADARFLRRVFTDAEAACIQAGPAPERMLWTLWAAKEAAFKLVQKHDPLALFAHRCYEVRPLGGTGRLRGTVHVTGARGPAWSVPVAWDVCDRFVHCLAVGCTSDLVRVRSAVVELAVDPPGATYDTPPEPPWSERELPSARSPESRAARRLAKRLALEAGLGDVEVVRWPGERRYGPPLLYPAGAAEPLGGWHATLSHDGGYVAAALCCVEGSPANHRSARRLG